MNQTKFIDKINRKKQGFTLAELLVVVAIIAVLVAISIPIFNSQLEKSRNATDVYNARVMGDAIQIYYMSNPDKLDDLTKACKSNPYYVQISVGPNDTKMDNVLKPALEEAGILPSVSGGKYQLGAESQVNWKGYIVAVGAPLASNPGVVRVEYRGIPITQDNPHYKWLASLYWPVNKDETGFNNAARGK